MTEIKLTKRYPHSRTEDIVDAYMRGLNNALDAVQNGKFHIAEQTEPQTEEWHDDCNTCRWHDGACTIPCCDYEPKTEPQLTAKCPFDDSLPCEWVCTEFGKCKYKPQTDCSWK